ncbi:MAG: oligosaccharide flippase family protein, partial [Geminicoccaceae bacterium]
MTHDFKVAFLLRVLAIFCNVSLSIILARNLSSGGYGQYAVAIAFIGLISIPIQLGLPALVVYQSAAYRAVSQLTFLKGLLVSSYILIILSSLILCFLLIIYIPSIASNTNIPTMTLKFALWLTPLFALASVSAAFLRGAQRPLLAQALDQVFRPSIFLFVVIFLCLTIDNLKTYEIMKAQVLSLLPVVLFGIILVIGFHRKCLN